MNYVEWTKDQNSIFAELDDLNPNGIIGELGVGYLEVFYEMNYGQRKVPNSIELKTTAETAFILNGLYMNQWERLKEIFDTHLPIGFENETVIQEKYIDVDTKEIDNNNTNKTTAFNTTDFTDENSSDSTINEINNRERDKEYSKKSINLQSVEKQRTMIENENMSRAICVNISSIVGLSIY